MQDFTAVETEKLEALLEEAERAALVAYHPEEKHHAEAAANAINTELAQREQHLDAAEGEGRR